MLQGPQPEAPTAGSLAESGSVSLAVLNMLDDLSDERDLHRASMRATLNILEDESEAALRVERVQPAILNILEDASEAARRMEGIQPALLNILEDLEGEKANVLTLNNELEARVIRRTDELDRINRNMEAFTYSVAHDLRAPLRAMSGFSEALLDELGEGISETGRDYARRVRDASRKMSVLIDELLQLSQVSRAELHREEIDLSSMARSIASDLTSQAPERRAKFDIVDRLVAYVDRSLIQTVLENLIGNAWKFTAKREMTLISFESLAAETGRLGFFVRDNGAGFDPAFADRLFQPFQRLHKAVEYPGNGIGLASVSRIIERHGGRVWAEGQVDRGASFHFTVSTKEQTNK